MNIREAEPKDRTAVLNILNEFRLEQEFEPEEMLLAEIDGEVVGCVRLKHFIDCYELCSVAVKEEYQGNGIGSKLIESCLANADAAVYCFTFAPEFFGKFGFAAIEKEALPQELKARASGCTADKIWTVMVRR